jgi:hypoxanthine-DNA glycosylase
VLVLGSMPGAASLAAGQYYAHPRNLFWTLMGEMLGFDPALPYARRIAALKRAHVALWDVIGACARIGSLDARIDPGSVVVNDFGGFLARHRALTLICFNGTTAAASWRRHVQTSVADRGLRSVTLPSSSPANASIALVAKRRAWSIVREAAAGGR